MWLTSTEVSFPSGFDFVFMAVDLEECGFQLSRLKAEVIGQCDLGREPELCLSVGRVNMHMHTGLFPREEKEPEVAILENRRAHGSDLEILTVRKTWSGREILIFIRSYKWLMGLVVGRFACLSFPMRGQVPLY
jgi:hypothetical protein